MIMSSVRPFYFNGRRYRKILYLVIEPHRALFDKNHKHHTDVINITLESYAIYKDKETGEEKTNHETFRLDMCAASSMTGWDYETMNEAYRIETNPEKPLWVTFRFGSRDSENKGSRQNNDNFNKEKKFDNRNQTSQKPKNGQKGGYIEGNTYVTTNKNGIRKEVPIRSNEPRKNTKKDLDSMMKDSGMFDDEKFERGNRYDRKKNKGKKGRNNRRFDDRYDY